MSQFLWATTAWSLIALLSAHGAYGQGTGNSKAATARNKPTAPLVLAEQGSFFVNEQQAQTSFGAALGTRSSDLAKALGVSPDTAHTISVKGMYVQYQAPQTRARPSYPTIMVHGSGHTGKTYESTPDGRMGWAEYFVRQGFPAYVVDHAGRARSGFDPSPSNTGKLDNKADLVPGFQEFTNESAWINFRFGSSPFVAYPDTKFPVSAKDQYFAQIVPNTESSFAEGDWPGRMAECIGLVNRIKTVGGTAENIHLTDKGVRGNSHMLMMDTNNQELAAMIATWLRQHAFESPRK